MYVKKVKGPEADSVANEETAKKFFNDFGMYVCVCVCVYVLYVYEVV
jgi:hypothetical protein